ncbi:unnamed protein product [Orchesella dallaii]|uniref:F-box domain-containing protein n=1 Tax=Orchesella dallaii TaxID=48710 RepID=A0ABP1QYV2_9HEXA
MNTLKTFDYVSREGGTRGEQPPVEEETVNKNPLLINVVLDKIFNMMPVEDLMTSRLVCKLWWESSLPQWRKSCHVQIRGDRQDGSWWIVKGSTPPHPSPYSIQNFLDFMEEWGRAGDPFQFEKFPFHKFNLGYVNLDLSKNSRERRGQLEFWKVVGAQMTHLKISKSAFNNVQTFKMILFELTPKLEALKLDKNFYNGCPRPRFTSPSLGQARPLEFVKNCQESLKEMNIVLREFDAESLYRSGKCDPIELPLSWAHILGYFPNIVSVHLESLDSEDYNCPCLDRFWYTVINLRKGSPNALNLNVLNIMNAKMNALYALPTSVLSNLKSLHWPLTSLTLDAGVTTGSNVLGEVLHIHAATLKMLTVFRAPYSHPFPNFPFGVQLNSLEELKVIGPICKDLRFLEFMPQLKRLLIGDEDLYKPFEFVLEPADISSMEYKNPESVIVHTDFGLIPDLVLSHLVEFNGGEEQVCPLEKVPPLARLMPNLKILELKVVGDGGAIDRLRCDVIQYWKDLENVNLAIHHGDSNVGDYSLTQS